MAATVDGRPQLTLSETETTLFALGIRADTGALTYPATTPRDAYALAWLMEIGCSQSAIAEFGQARLSAHQRDLLAEAMGAVELQQHNGLKLGMVLLDTGRGFVTGMASVAEELLELLACDGVLIGVVHYNAKAQPFLSLIGRTRTAQLPHLHLALLHPSHPLLPCPSPAQAAVPAPV